MNTIESRKYEMLVRVRDFGEAYAARFPESTLAKPLFAKVASAVTDLQANDMRAALQKLDVLDQISGKTKIVGTAGAATRDEENIVRRAIALLDKTDAGTRPVRLLGVSVHNLSETRPRLAPREIEGRRSRACRSRSVQCDSGVRTAPLRCCSSHQPRGYMSATRNPSPSGRR